MDYMFLYEYISQNKIVYLSPSLFYLYGSCIVSKPVYEYLWLVIIPPPVWKTAGGGGIGMAERLSHVWPYISVANRDRVLKFKISSTQTKMYLKKIFLALG